MVALMAIPEGVCDTGFFFFVTIIRLRRWSTRCCSSGTTRPCGSDSILRREAVAARRRQIVPSYRRFFMALRSRQCEKIVSPSRFWPAVPETDG